MDGTIFPSKRRILEISVLKICFVMKISIFSVYTGEILDQKSSSKRLDLGAAFLYAWNYFYRNLVWIISSF